MNKVLEAVYVLSLAGLLLQLVRFHGSFVDLGDLLDDSFSLLELSLHNERSRRLFDDLHAIDK